MDEGISLYFSVITLHAEFNTPNTTPSPQPPITLHYPSSTITPLYPSSTITPPSLSSFPEFQTPLFQPSSHPSTSTSVFFLFIYTPSNSTDNILLFHLHPSIKFYIAY
ncbi:hypothetical protein Pcinc_031323 [Petrolisthes cinctipes]|uniref:Uncharacterized protein n=1 Tax=Petrolisthes cinctipes TaxID=88211 RepID=A0AAE1K188_PETCI|nr:hypothetical protein Pcinc_031323 [Petrolisthes cinctipes]